PGQSATVDAVVEDVWPLGWVSADVEATQRPVGEDPPFPVTVMAASKGTWAPPWSQLGVVLVVVAVVVLWRKRRAVRRTRNEKAIAEAKAAGAREAAGADSVAGAGELGPLGEPPPVTDDGAIEVAEVEVAEVTDEPVANGVAVGE